MALTAFVHGFALSVGLIAAVGPQNVFVFQQGAVQPRLRRSIPTVVTAGVADTVLILLGVLGVSAVVIEYAWLRTVLLGGGVAFLLYVGLDAPVDSRRRPEGPGG
ncbi:LysE family transporter [Halorubrum sp. AD140]|uniref:LysE/ArgO family amino acid transporter n=1 Tax=Halorubrum sp. AD140 TaxID=3050073 RepID=UPI002ACCC675|nr:LysE family transporter [Halorubrum sp. AD140]MDZ5813020.1 LysE family transporter [Halorubrum sp. AD140]